MGALDQEKTGGNKCLGLSTFNLLQLAKSTCKPKAKEARSGLLRHRARVGGPVGLWVRRDGGRISNTFSFPFFNTEQSLFPLFYRNGYFGKPGKINPANN